MASRRLRTKAVINLPVRRGRDVEDTSSQPYDKHKDVNKPIDGEICKPSSVQDENNEETTNAPQILDLIEAPEPTVSNRLVTQPVVTARKRLKPLVNIPARKERLNISEVVEKITPTKDVNVTLRSPKKPASTENITKEKQSPQMSLDVETVLTDTDNTLDLSGSTYKDDKTTNKPEFLVSTPNIVLEDGNVHTLTLSQPKSLVSNSGSSKSGNSKELPEPDSIQQLKTPEKRTTHRRIRKNGVVEMLTKARRDFQNKFGNKTPDKKKLTMFDLIFYNPSTNPMKISEQEQNETAGNTSVKPSDEITERLAEESVDDLNLTEQIEDDVSAMPAPQVKVGPDGSLIIDEQSLVIETTGSRQRKDELANSVVVMDYGIGNTTYSSFSNKRKGKEWPKEETLKFYRALHSVGTDFQLMQSIFPKRTRRDLKLKFKKEDKSNRELIDKALRYPLEFNLTSMEKDLEQEKENEEKLHQELERKKKLKQAQLIKKRKCKSIKGFLGRALNVEDRNPRPPKKFPFNGMTDDIDGVDVVNDVQEVGTHRVKQAKKRKHVRSIEQWESSSSSDTDINCSDIELPLVEAMEPNAEEKTVETDCEVGSVLLEVEEESTMPTLTTLSTLQDIDVSSSDDEQVFLKTTRQTRYGRIPQRRVLSSEESEDEAQPLVVSNEAELPRSITDLSNIEPGSIVIFSSPDSTNYKLFMVGPKGSSSLDDAIAMTVHPNILATVTESMEPQALK